MIPEGWRYELHVIKKWPFITKIPVAWIVEGVSQIQCLCPNCDYGNGYNEPYIASCPEKKILQCKKCGITFIGYV